MNKNHKSVFISHSSKNQEISETICQLLEENDISCWIAPRDIHGGQLYAEAIVDGIVDCDVFLLLLSGDSCISRPVIREIEMACRHEKVIIPFSIEDCQISNAILFYIAAIQIIKGFPSPEKRIASLIKALEPHIVRNVRLDISEEDMVSIPGAPKQSGKYEMLQNAAGEILMIIEYRPTPPENPRLIYDGGEQALLYLNREAAFMINNLSEEARNPLKSVSEVLVVELEENNDNLAREYKVPVRIVKSLDVLKAHSS